MPKSLLALGAGPATGRAVARRYAQEGYDVVLVARRGDQLAALADEVRASGTAAHVIAADLAQRDTLPDLIERVRTAVGAPDAIYYGVAPDGFVPVTDLTVEQVEQFSELGLYALLTIVRAFLPAMLERRDGAILTVQGASALRGNPAIAGGLCLAAQRNYLQAVRAAVSDRNVRVGALYVGAAIEHSAWYEWHERAKAAGEDVPDLPVVDPAHLAGILWAMDRHGEPGEAAYPERALET